MNNKMESAVEEIINSLDDDAFEALARFNYDARLSVLKQYKKQKKLEKEEE